MSEKQIPKMSPKIAKASEELLTRLKKDKRARLRILKKQLSRGQYQPTSTALAHSLVGVK